MKNVGRKIYHAFGGIILLGVYIIAGRRLAFVLFAILLAGILLFDFARMRIPAFGLWAQAKLSSLLRPGEEGKISGSPSYVLGIALALYFFDLPVASAAVLFLAFGDVAASIVGESWGRTKFLGKSLEGTAAFVGAGMLAGMAAGAIGYSPSLPVLAAGAVVAAAAEALTPKSLNDNLTIPLLSGLAMTFVGGVF